jgi:hypothetical protein
MLGVPDRDVFYHITFEAVATAVEFQAMARYYVRIEAKVSDKSVYNATVLNNAARAVNGLNLC